jgi:hypothetical protein
LTTCSGGCPLGAGSGWMQTEPGTEGPQENGSAIASERPVEFVEEPLALDSKGVEDGLLGLSADYPVPIALDESIVGRGGHRALARTLGWKGYFIIKPSLMGDVHGVRGKLEARARAHCVFLRARDSHGCPGGPAPRIRMAGDSVGAWIRCVAAFFRPSMLTGRPLSLSSASRMSIGSTRRRYGTRRASDAPRTVPVGIARPLPG